MMSTYIDIMAHHLLLACGVAAGPLFTLVHLTTGATRPGFDQLRHPVSSLALGRPGWTQVLGFCLGGALSLAFAVGLWRAGDSRWGAGLIAVWAVSLLGAGAFRTDPVRGYPPGTPEHPVQPSRAGTAHDLVSLVGFLALTAACCVLAWSRSTGWALYSIASAVGFATAMALSNLAFGPNERLAPVGGLLQRVSLTIGWTWLTLLAARTLST